MRIREKFGSLLEEYRPRVGTAFLTALDIDGVEPPDVDLPEGFTSRIITSGDDPLLLTFSPSWQRRMAAERLDSGDWYVLVILDGDKLIGHFWASMISTKGLFNGVIDVNVGADEAYGFDLYLHPDYRRGKIGNFVANSTIMSLRERNVKVGYTHVLFDNAPSIFWHHGVGFNWVQVFNYVNIGPRIWWKIPFSASPRYGPLSRKGRFNDKNPQMPFGSSMLPQGM
jgi:L-amino acid N-acyltransferase YncA